MADDVVYDAIRTYLGDTAVTLGADVLPIRWDNEGFTKPEDAPWIAVDLTGTLYGQVSLGASPQSANRWDETGELWLHVFVPAGSGSRVARRYVKALADLFRGKNDLLSGNLEFRDAFIARGAPAPEEGNWFRMTVTIEWRRIDA